MPFEFLAASNRTTVRWKDLLKMLPVIKKTSKSLQTKLVKWCYYLSFKALNVFKAYLFKLEKGKQEDQNIDNR